MDSHYIPSIMLGETEVNQVEAFDIIEWLATARTAIPAERAFPQPIVLDEIEQQLIDLAYPTNEVN